MGIIKTCCYETFQKEFQETASVWVLVHLFIPAVCCVAYFFQNRKTFPNSRQTMHGYAVTLLVYSSCHTLHIRMWRIFRYLLCHILSKLRITRHFLKDYHLNKVSGICVFACLPSWSSVKFRQIKPNNSLFRLNMIAFPKSALSSFDIVSP